MPIDKFGRFSQAGGSIGAQGPQGLKGIGFSQTLNGDYDLCKKRIINLKNPVENNDATSKDYVDNRIKELKNSINELSNSLIFFDLNMKKTTDLVDELCRKIVTSESIREYMNTCLDALYRKIVANPDKKKADNILRNRNPWAPSLPGSGIQGIEMSENIQRQLAKNISI